MVHPTTNEAANYKKLKNSQQPPNLWILNRRFFIIIQGHIFRFFWFYKPRRVLGKSKKRTKKPVCKALGFYCDCAPSLVFGNMVSASLSIMVFEFGAKVLRRCSRRQGHSSFGSSEAAFHVNQMLIPILDPVALNVLTPSFIMKEYDYPYLNKYFRPGDTFVFVDLQSLQKINLGHLCQFFK